MLKRLVGIGLFIGISYSFAMAQTPAILQGWCQNGNVTVTIQGQNGASPKKYQQSYPSCTVTVYDAGTLNISTIYSDTSSTPKANPFTSASTGIWSFFANDGTYDVKFSGGGIPAPFSMGNFSIFNNNGGKGPWSIVAGTLTTSTVATSSFKITVADNSPPSGPAGLIGTTYVPDVFNFTLNASTAGQKVGQNGVGVMQQGSIGKSYTTTTQSITGNVVAQTISVSDSSVFIPTTNPISSSFCATIDPGTAVGECVTLTAIPNSTHVTAVFANNHSNGAVIGERYSSSQTTLAVTGNDVLTNGTGSPGNNDTFGVNIGVQAKSPSFHEVDAIEIDAINNTGVDAAYVGSGNKPVLYGGTIVSAGTNHSSYGFDITSGGTSSKFLTGLELGGIKDNGITIVNNGAGSVGTGINIAAATNYGIVIGPNQTAPSAPSFPLSGPTHGLYNTANSSMATAASIDTCWEERVASVNHYDCLQGDGAGDFIMNRDGAYSFIGWVPSSGASTARSFIATSSANNTDPKIYVSDLAGTTITAKMTSLGQVMGTTFATRLQCSSTTGTCGASPVGQVTIAAGATTVTVSTSAVNRNGSSNSNILIQENSGLSVPLGVTCNTTLGRTYAVTTQTDGTSFVITSSAAPAANPACLSYFIFN